MAEHLQVERRMVTYKPIEQVAEEMAVPMEALTDLVSRRMIQTVEKRDVTFVSDRECYKLRFIYYLKREHHLPLPEIDHILQTHQPPYRDWKSQVQGAPS